MTQVQFDNEATHGLGECPGCGASIHVVASPAEGQLRWCCLTCMTTGSAPFDAALLQDSGESEDETPVALH